MIISKDLTIVILDNIAETMAGIQSFVETVSVAKEAVMCKITDISIWNALANGISYDFIISKLGKGIPDNVHTFIQECVNKFGLVRLEREVNEFKLVGEPNELLTNKQLNKIREDNGSFKIHMRGEVKSICMQLGFPVLDRIGYEDGEALPMTLKADLRYYQKEAIDSIAHSGNGLIVSPCGSGKTVMGLGCACRFQTSTLVITSKAMSVEQWGREFKTKTSVDPNKVGVYLGKDKQVKPITIVTYNMLAYKKDGEYIHLNRIMSQNFGLVIFDEVHKMPSKLFRVAAMFQSKKRVALTATFVREDGREKDIFTLIGPKTYDKPWKELENVGFISKVNLQVIKSKMKNQSLYNTAKDKQSRFQIASSDPNKLDILDKLLAKHKEDTVLIIGEFKDQLEQIRVRYQVPLIIGDTPHVEREKLFTKMREGSIKVLVASRVANEALDIPNINVVIQVSFFYGSRSEEAQRVGRCTRPKQCGAFYYTIITQDSLEEHYNLNRKIFLSEQGYTYEEVA